MSVYRHLFRLRLAAQLQSRRSWGLALLFCLAFTFLFGQAVAFCYWVICFLIFIYAFSAADQYLLTQFPISRRQIIRSHYLYCLLLSSLSCLLFLAISSLNPWQLGAGLSQMRPLVLLFSLSLIYDGLGFYLYYRGFKYAQLYYIACYILILGLLNYLDHSLSAAIPLPIIILCLAASLILYGGFCRLTSNYFLQKDLL